MNYSVDVIVVNWNSGRQLRNCLKSIATAQTDGFYLTHVVIVDNASYDSSLKEIESVNLPLRIILNHENQGFAVACNQGAKESSADYLLFLNPDTILFPDSLVAPLDFIGNSENSLVGIVSIQMVDEAGKVSRNCARFPTVGSFFAKMLGLDRLVPSVFPSHFMTEWGHNETRDVDQVMGSFFLTRRSLFESLGGFDERFFVYFEEVDISLRARQAGWRSVFLANAQAFHAGGGTSRQVKAHRLFYSLRSRLLYGFKHFKPWQALTLLGVSLGVEPISRVVFALLRGAPGDVRNTLNAYAMLYRDLPNIFKRAQRP